MPRIVNLTPHTITILSQDGETLAQIPPSGTVARVSMGREHVGSLSYQGAEIPLVRPSYGEVEGLPELPEPDTLYVVSVLVAQALADDPTWRGRLLVPDTGPGSVVRDADGRIVGVRYLQVW